VLDQGYPVQEAAEAIRAGVSTLDKWARKAKSECGCELNSWQAHN